jgi:hypothetical protein
VGDGGEAAVSVGREVDARCIRFEIKHGADEGGVLVRVPLCSCLVQMLVSR